MNKTERYIKTVIKRRNALKEAVFNFFLNICSWPRLLLDVFLRRNMGERHFSMSQALMLAVILAALPWYYSDTLRYAYHDSGFSLFFTRFLTWYVYLAGFLYMSFLRNEEVRRLPGVFDFARYSRAEGSIHPKFYGINFGGKPVSVHTIETVLEPGLFFSIGFILWTIGQPVGILLMVCSIIYSLSYIAAYDQGTNYLMDIIDDGIVQEELAKSITEGRDARDTRGFNFHGRRPADPETRRQVADMLTATEETVEAV